VARGDGSSLRQCMRQATATSSAATACRRVARPEHRGGVVLEMEAVMSAGGGSSAEADTCFKRQSGVA
jgi:hypothetical protein